jgi:ABC-type transporter Mla MlaB component
MDSIRFAIRPPLTRTELPGLYRRICSLFELSGARTAYCDVRGIAADAVAIDALARLKLAARRRGVSLEVLGASPELRALIGFAGLDRALRLRGQEEGRTAKTGDR